MASTYLLPHCSVCVKPFNYGGPEAYLLPCLHSVCDSCLNHNCKTISCSRCEESFSKEDYIFLKDCVTKAEVFTSNIKKNPSEITCTNKNHRNVATVWCNECQKFLCQVCKVSHSQEMNSHADDVVLVKNLIASGRTLRKRPRCPEHESVLDMYDVTCEVLICSKCATSEHKQCHTREVEHASVGGERKILQKEQKKLGGKLQEVFSAIEKTASKQTEIEARHADMKKVVSHCFDSLRDLVTKREQELLKMLENKHISKGDDIQRMNQQLEKTAEKVRAVHDYTGKLLAQGHTGDLLMLKNNIKSRADACLSEEVNVANVGDVMVTFSKAKLADLKKCISKFGDVDTMEEEGDEPLTLYENIEWETASKTNRSSESKKMPHATKHVNNTPNRPAILFDIEKLNINKAHINNDRMLVNSKLPTERMLDQYVGTTSINPLSGNKQTYWEVETDFAIDEEMQKTGLLMEVGVIEGDELDQQYCVSSQSSSRCLSIAHCATHKGICAKVWNRGIKVKCIEDALYNKSGERVTLKHGIQHDGERNSLMFLDLNKMEVIDVLDGDDDGSEEIWPIFGVYNSTLASVKMQLVSGDDIQMTDEKVALFKQ